MLDLDPEPRSVTLPRGHTGCSGTDVHSSGVQGPLEPRFTHQGCSGFRPVWNLGPHSGVLRDSWELRITHEVHSGTAGNQGLHIRDMGLLGT